QVGGRIGLSEQRSQGRTHPTKFRSNCMLSRFDYAGGDPIALASSPTPVSVRTASSPFRFNSASHLLRIGKEKANSLEELLEALRTCPEASIFQHTFQTLEEHHFIREGFSNDFSHWAFAACNEMGLAERLAALDVREFTS